jgi:hypothetical protein
MNIALVDDETSPNTGKHIVLQLLENLVKKMKLECHLAALAICQYKVRIVAIGTDIYNLIRGDSYQFGTGRYSEPFHVHTGLTLQIYLFFRNQAASFVIFN